MTGALNESAFSRKAFLKGGGALIVAFGLPLTASSTASGQVAPFPVFDGSQLDSWLSVGQDGKVTVMTGRVEFGTHKSTSFAQIVAEELDVAFDAVRMVMGDTARVVDQGSSTASDGLLIGSRPLRHAAAEARRVLLELASERLGVPASSLSVSNGVVSGGGRSATYGELIGGQRFNTTLRVLVPGAKIEVEGQARIKDASQYKVIGKSIPSVSIPGKVTGAAPNVTNIRLPGMVHARVVMPPSVGARLVSVDGFKSKVPGLIKVVRKGNFLAVVTENEWEAIQALDSIKTTWTETPSLTGHGNVFHYLRTAPVKNRANVGPQRGDVDAALAGAAKVIAAEYNFPVNYHGMISPPCAVANVVGGQATCWTGTQAPGGTQREVAKVLGLPERSVRVIPVENSGAYGRMGTDDVTPAAAYISQQVGRPVRLRWMRDQEHGWAPMQAPAAYNMRAGVDSTGKIVAWDHLLMGWGLASNSILPTYLMEDGTFSAGNASAHQPGGGDTGTYAFDNMRVIAHTVEAQLRGTFMRSPGRIATNFAGEQFLDEIAAATGQDPIAIRLRHLADNTDPYTRTSVKPRAAAVIEAVRQASGWQTRPSPGPGASSNARVVSGRGIGVVASQRSAYIANVAEVEVDRKTGKVRVKKMTVVADGGQIVNPGGIRAQIEGATLYSMSRALKEQVRFTRSKIVSSDWVTYPILRFEDLPDTVDIVLINRPDLAEAGSFDNGRMGTYVNSGIGEPPNTVVPAAIANAFFDATGVRMRQLPLTPARVRAALRAAGK